MPGSQVATGAEPKVAVRQRWELSVLAPEPGNQILLQLAMSLITETGPLRGPQKVRMPVPEPHLLPRHPCQVTDCLRSPGAGTPGR